MTRRYSHPAPGVLRTAVEAMDREMLRVPVEGGSEETEGKKVTG